MIRVETPTRAHIEHVAATMRPEDVRELWNLSRVTPLHGLSRAVEVSDRVHVALVDGVPTTFFGVQETALGDVAHPWMLTAPVPRACRRYLLLAGRGIVRLWAAGYARMDNLVDVDNTPAQHLIRSLGFTVAEEATRVFTGHRAKLFWMGATDV